MSKIVKSCKVTLRKFKTARGRPVQFMGRSAGSKTHGGECTPKAPSAAVKAHRRDFAQVARKCARGIPKGKNFIKRQALCVKSQLKALSA